MRPQRDLITRDEYIKVVGMVMRGMSVAAAAREIDVYDGRLSADLQFAGGAQKLRALGLGHLEAAVAQIVERKREIPDAAAPRRVCASPVCGPVILPDQRQRLTFEHGRDRTAAFFGDPPASRSALGRPLGAGE